MFQNHQLRNSLAVLKVNEPKCLICCSVVDNYEAIRLSKNYLNMFVRDKTGH